MAVDNSPLQASYLNTETPIAACTASGFTSVYITATKLVTVVAPNTAPVLYDITGHGAKDIAPLDSDRFVLALANGLMIYSLSTGLVKKIVISSANVSRVKVRNGYILHQRGNNVSFYDQQLTKKASQSFGVTELMDFELDTDNFLYASGFQAQKNFNAGNLPVHIAFLYKMKFTGIAIQAIPNSPTGENLGKLWGYNAATLSNDMADTRLNRLYIHGDKLYCLGSVYGGNSIFRYNGKDLSTKTQIAGDIYSQTWQTRDETGTYIGIVDLNTFVVLRGQEYRTRKDNNDGNTLFPRTVFADGTDIYISALAGFKIPNRSTQTWLNQPLPAYKGDASFIVVNDALTQRKAWVTPGDGEPLVFNDYSALIKTTNPALATTDNTSSKPSYLIVW